MTNQSTIKNIWVEKYRPQTLEECILPAATKKRLLNYVEQSADGLPNFLFIGTSGIGKTSAARAMLKAVGAEVIVINASLEGNVDTIRTRVMQYASTVSLTGGMKFVVFEEVDNMTQAAQKALRAFIEEFTGNCGYIFTGNKIQNFDTAILSRLMEIEFAFSPSEKPDLAKQVSKMLMRILDAENVKYEVNDIRHLLIDYLRRSTDLRQLLIRVQKACIDGVFVPTLISSYSARLSELIAALKSKKMQTIRTWVGENSDIPGDAIFTFLYENIDEIARADNTAIAAMIAHIAEHQAQHSQFSNPEINVAACLIDIVADSV